MSGDILDRRAPLGGVGHREVEQRGRVREPLQVRLESLQVAVAEADRLEDAVAAGGGQVENAELRGGGVGGVVAGGGAVVVERQADQEWAGCRSSGGGVARHALHRSRSSRSSIPSTVGSRAGYALADVAEHPSIAGVVRCPASARPRRRTDPPAAAGRRAHRSSAARP